jgi:hypothetical protein
MQTISQISTIIRENLIENAEALGRETGFVKRASKLGASDFVLSVVCGVMGAPKTSYTHLCQTAKVIGVEISPQGLEQRFTPEANQLLHGVLQKMIIQRISGSPTRLAILQHFKGVFIRDSSCIRLPKALHNQFPGVGCQQGISAGIKLHVRLDINSGELAGPEITNARVHDRKSPFHEETIPAGGLRMADLGFFDLDQFARDSSNQVYWLSRYKVGTFILTLSGTRVHLPTLLKNCDRLDMPILLGQKHRIPCRLLAYRVPQEVADQRRRRLREYATRKQVSLLADTLFLAGWTLLITNAPLTLLSLPEALVVYKVRWQIELLFKLWKQSAKIDEWRSQNPDRLLSELYGKLIAVVIMHWQFVIAFWAIPAHSLSKAAQVMQSFAACLACTIKNEPRFADMLQTIQQVLMSTCLLNSRRAKPNTYQLLAEGLA